MLEIWFGFPCPWLSSHICIDTGFDNTARHGMMKYLVHFQKLIFPKSQMYLHKSKNDQIIVQKFKSYYKYACICIYIAVKNLY